MCCWSASACWSHQGPKRWLQLPQRAALSSLLAGYDIAADGRLQLVLAAYISIA